MDYWTYIPRVVRSTIALSITGGVIYLVVTGDIDPKTFLAMAGPIIGWYFSAPKEHP